MGIPLADLYEELVDLVALDRAERYIALTARLVDLLLPVVQLAAQWRLGEATVLARGLALEPREPELEIEQALGRT
jgi:hypothetical protein